MNVHRFRSFAIAALVAAPAAALGMLPALADTTVPAPVTIESCGPIAAQRDLGAPGSTFSPAPTFLGLPTASSLNGGMSVTFVNHAPKVAKLVNVVVESPGTHFVIRDIGTFSPDVTITNTFHNGGGGGYLMPAYIAQDVRCRVGVVEFADGSLWRYGEMVPAASGPYHLVATPDRVPLELGAEAAVFLVQAPSNVAGFQESDSCVGVAAVNVGAAGDASISYSVRPLAKGSCVAHVTSENGSSLSVPIIVR
jgi:hypothetical protein